MRRYIMFGKEISEEEHSTIYTEFVAALLSALTTAGMIGIYHVIFHIG
ncbi:MAG: hypothetical protein QF704_16215 [Anaerolineales bacterium]|nr:hypothetical protein [Anaerolineales bacterium]